MTFLGISGNKVNARARGSWHARFPCHNVTKMRILAELRARASVAPLLSKSIHPRKFGNHVTVHRPPDRPSWPQGNECWISHFLASLGAQVQLDIAHPCCDQLTAVKTRYPLTSITWPYRGLRYRPIEVEYFLKLSADNLLVFKLSHAQDQFV